MTVFKVRQKGDTEWTEINAMDADDAVADYCDVIDGVGGFEGKYPSGDTFEVWHERGIMKVFVDTDFTPNFTAYAPTPLPWHWPGGAEAYFARYPDEKGPGD